MSAGHRHSVLLIEDNDGLREVFSIALEERGCRVLGEASPRDALAEPPAGDAPCVVICDWHGLGLDPPTSILALRQRIPSAAFVIMSGDDRVPRLALGCGVQRAVVKPVTSTQLLQMIADLCRHDAPAPH